MAEYIENVVAQTSKLDWAFPFERKGQFPLDRSALFSSLADANKYAAGDGTDERKLGGTSYVGQVISVYEAAEEEKPASVNAYIITPTRSLLKLASTTATGDIANDIDVLDGRVSALEKTIAAMYTNEQIDEKLKALEDAIALLPTEDTNTTYTFTNGANGKFTVTPSNGEAFEVDTGVVVPTKVSELENDSKYQTEDQVSSAIEEAVGDIVIPEIPKNVSAFINDAGYQNADQVAAAIAAIDHLKKKIVNAKPSVEEAELNVIYMVKSSSLTTGDIYTEYMKLQTGGTEEAPVYEVVQIGDTSTDLSDYAKSADVAANYATKDELGDKADAQVVTDLAALVDNKADASLLGNYVLAESLPGILEPYAKSADVTEALKGKVDNKTVEDLAQVVEGKADSAATLAGYGITDAYTATQTDEKIDEKIGTPTTLDADGVIEEPGTGIYTNVYTKEEIAKLIANVTGGASAGEVKDQLEQYIGTNDARVNAIEDSYVSEEDLNAKGYVTDDELTAKNYVTEEALEAKQYVSYKDTLILNCGSAIIETATEA